MQADSGTGRSAPDLDQITKLLHNPQPPAAPQRRRVFRQPARQRIGDLARVLDLAHELMIGCPYRHRSRAAAMSQRVGRQLTHGHNKVAHPVRRQASPPGPLGSAIAERDGLLIFGQT